MSTNPKRFLAGGLRLAATALVPLVMSCAAASAASVVVMDASFEGLSRGQELNDDLRLNIPAGGHLLVGVIQNSQLKQIDIVGPRTGSVRDLLNPEPTSSKLWTMLLHLVRTGGANERGTGATRSLRPVAPARLMVNNVAVAGNMAVCVEEGSSPTIAVASAGDGSLVHISDGKGDDSALKLPANGSAWPTSVPLHDGSLYRIKVENGAEAIVEVHMVPTGTLRDTSSLRTLELLATRGCERQAASAFEKSSTAR